MSELKTSLQENLITLLAHSEEYGKLVARLIETKYYDGEYRLIAERCIDYWHKYNHAPLNHTADLFSDILEDKENKRANSLRQTLAFMAEHAESANGKYITDQARKFIRSKQILAALLQAYEKYKAGKEESIEGIEEDWGNILRQRHIEFDPGIGLDDLDRVLDYIERKQREFLTGIDELDRACIVPSRGTLMMFVAPAKAGKSWFLISVSKRALMLHKKVVHISLENSEEETVQRYWQAFWSISNRNAVKEVSLLKKSKRGDLLDIVPEKIPAYTTFDNDMIRDILDERIIAFTDMVRNIRIKRFPPGHLTPNQLRVFLDNLEQERFIPDILVLDYAGLMKSDPKNLRIEIGHNIRELRAIAVERNIAVVSAHQSNREALKAGETRAHNVGEDLSVVQTADTILTYSANEKEKELGLARLRIELARSEADAWGIIMTQNYDQGQFCIRSARMTNKYWDFVQLDDDEEETDVNDYDN